MTRVRPISNTATPPQLAAMIAVSFFLLASSSMLSSSSSSVLLKMKDEGKGPRSGNLGQFWN